MVEDALKVSEVLLGMNDYAGSFARARIEGKERQDFAVVGELDAAEVAGADARLVLFDAALEGE